jgi:uncharacterized delta-60 repeat protein
MVLMSCLADGSAMAQLAFFDFAQTTFRAAEDGGGGAVILQRWGNTNTAFSVDWFARSGTALAGVDFVGVTNTIQFAAGETSKVVTVPLLDDGLLEEAESILLSFGEFTSGASTGLVNSAGLIVDDNELPSILDASFNLSAAPSADVFAMVRQPDGRLLLGGNFSGLGWAGSVPLLQRPGVARLNADGSPDNSFATSSGVGPGVYAVARQADGKVLIGGGFTGSGTPIRQYLSRLNANGSLDADFAVTVNDELRAIVVQPDGRILIGGRFTTVNGQSRNRIARLNENGSLDTTFEPGTGADNNVRTLVLQPDGKMLIGGQFTTYDGVSRVRVARLESNGALDPAFNPGAGADNQVRAIAALEDGSCYIGGDFNTYQGDPRPALVRLLPNGDLDRGFDAGLATYETVRSILVQADGRVLAGGAIAQAHGLRRNDLVRFLPDGQPDPTLLTTFGPNNEVFAIVAQPDGQIVVGGQFTGFGLGDEFVSRPFVARLWGDSRTNTVEFATANTFVAEATGLAPIAVRRTGESSNPVAATCFTASGTAFAGTDFTSVTSTLAFVPLQVTNSFVVQVANDSLPESDEIAWLVVTNVVDAFSGARNTASLVIVDGLGFSITLRPPALDESSASGRVFIDRRGATNLPVALLYATSDGTAIAGVDYEPLSGRLELGALQRFASFDVRPINDSLFEGPESFLLTFREAATGQIVATTNVVITDNEIGVGFVATAFSASEEGGWATLSVICQWDLAAPVEVDYVTRDLGSAQADRDFVARSGTLVFSTNGEVQTITVPIPNDGLVENPETFAVELTAIHGPAALTATNAVVTIQDNDAGIELVADTYIASEGGGLAVITVRRQDDGTNTGTVRLALSEGTALAGQDYVPTNLTVVLPPGPDLREVHIAVLQDMQIESDETFHVLLSEPSPDVSLGSRTTAVVRLLDDDRPGGLDPGFRIRPEELPWPYGGNLVLSPASNGMVVVGGANLLERFSLDGTLDTNFLAGSHFFGYFSQTVPSVLPDGRILVGLVSSNSLANERTLVRLQTNGLLDPAFDCPVRFGRTRAIVRQPDGMILMAGSYDPGWWGPPVANNALLRVHPDGALDTNFNTGLFLPSANYYELPTTVEALALQPDGRILVAGQFTSVAGLSCDRILRFNTNGTPDPTFFRGPPPSAVTNRLTAVYALALQADGKILVGGSFTNLQGVPRNALTRLQPDGTVDLDFQPPFGPEVTVRAVRLAPNGQIYVGGGPYSGYGWSSPNFVARLQPDGSLDETFDPGLPPNGAVTDLAVLPDGDLLVAGDFSTFNGLPYPHVVRLKGGTRPYSRLELSPESLVLMETNRNVVFTVRRAGTIDRTTTIDFATVAGSATPGEDFAAVSGRLTFPPGEPLQTITVPLNDDWMFEGDETLRLELSNPTGGDTLLVQPAADITILDNDRPGTVDSGFRAGTDVNGPVEVARIQADGKILIGGDFGLVNGVSGPRYARLNPDGSLDTEFQRGTGGYDTVNDIAVYQDGRILIGGEFHTVLGQPRVGIARLLQDGAVDPSFTSAIDELGTLAQVVRVIAPQADGRILIGGEFSKVGGQSRRNLARLEASGALDPSFGTADGVSGAWGFNDNIWAIVPLTGGQVLIGGAFATVNNTAHPYLARLNVNGTLDPSFPPGAAPDGGVTSILLLPDGKLLVAGGFLNLGSVPRSCLARLLADGTPDPTAPPALGADNTVMRLLRQPDGRILLGGFFTTLNGVPRSRIARLNADLTLDESFDPGAGVAPGGWVSALARQADGAVVVGGSFASFAGLPTANLARVRGTFVPCLSSRLVPVPDGLGLTLFSQPGSLYVLEAATNVLHWRPVQTNRAAGNVLPLTDPSGKGWPQRFYRAVQFGP